MSKIFKNLFVKTYVKILITSLSISPNIFSMNKGIMSFKSDRDPHLHLQKNNPSLSQLDGMIPTPTIIQNNENSNNSYTNKKSNINDNRNNYKPVNNNIINFFLLGNLSKLADPEFYRGTFQHIGDLSYSLFKLVKENKKIAAGGLITSLYLALNLRLMYLYSKLKSSKCWSQWRSNLAIEELYLIPRQTFYNDLLTNIQTRYTNFRNFRDSLAPLSNFLEDVEQEEAYIRQYESLVKSLKWIRVSSFTIASHDLYKQLSKRSSRLLFIKSAFLNWYAEHNKLSIPEREVLVRRFPGVKGILKAQDYNIDISQIEQLLPEESTEHILEKIVQI